MASAVAVRGFGNLADAALAAMLGQVADQAVHVTVLGAVDQVAALLLDGNEASVGQFLQVEGQGIAGHAELIGEDAGRASFRPGDDQGAEYTQSLRVGQRTQGGNGLIFIHYSMIQQLWNQ